MKKILHFLGVLSFFVAFSCGDVGEETLDPLSVSGVFVGTLQLTPDGSVTTNIPIDQSITIQFTGALEESSLNNAVSFRTEVGDAVPFQLNVNNSSVTLFPNGPLSNGTVYRLQINAQLKGARGEKFDGFEVAFKTVPAALELISIRVGDRDITSLATVKDLPLNLNLSIEFSTPVDVQSAQAGIQVIGPDFPEKLLTFSNDGKTVTLTSSAPVRHLSKFQLSLASTLRSAARQTFAGMTKTLYTTTTTTPQQPLVSDADLLTKVQQQTFKYFWDLGHPASGMAREGNTTGDLVTIGGSGFGLMAIIVAIERGFITRQQGIQRLEKMVGFLETADRFHGAWSHWVNGSTGKVIPFSTNDNGGDLVETSFMVQGLITFRQYLSNSNPSEAALITRINTLVDGVEWDWYTRGGQNVLYWHWSADKDWIMNHQIKGYNECLITYVLAASSATHSISLATYQQGWASSGGMVNGKSFYGTTLPLGFDYGGPLFFTHYSFLGLDPRNLNDQYANYWTQNVSHTLINHQHSVVNPQQYVGYSDENWGLTASNNQNGYSAHSPTNDLGVIAPTAALSSFPYTPEHSMKALKFFYYTLGDRLWGEYGFYDAFNLTEGWTASSYLAIDQGPIVVMIENYRTGLLWNLFMSAPEVKTGLNKLNFTY